MDKNTVVEFATFLAFAPPGKVQEFERQGLCVSDTAWRLRYPSNLVYCQSAECEQNTWHDPDKEDKVISQRYPTDLVTYKCRHCMQSEKIYALIFRENGQNLEVTKFGEWPPFGPPTPAKLITLIGPDRENFLKGRRAENQGLGIGAFAYYRRVVENQKNRLLDAIIKAAKEESADPAITKLLEDAKNETQFSKAIENVKPGIPESLKLNGHNPLTLLHTALSEGLHADSDEDCLKYATHVRTILGMLAERMDMLRADREKLKAAFSELQNKNPKQS